MKDDYCHSECNSTNKKTVAQEKQPLGIKLDIETKGVQTYKLEYVDKPSVEDEVVDIEDIKIFVNLKPLCF